jgi:hypothetical protein
MLSSNSLYFSSNKKEKFLTYLYPQICQKFIFLLAFTDNAFELKMSEIYLFTSLYWQCI